MRHRKRRGFTAAEKTELWDRWQRGESLKGIDTFVGIPTPLLRITKTHPICRGRTRRTQFPSIEI